MQFEFVGDDDDDDDDGDDGDDGGGGKRNGRAASSEAAAHLPFLLSSPSYNASSSLSPLPLDRMLEAFARNTDELFANKGRQSPPETADSATSAMVCTEVEELKTAHIHCPSGLVIRRVDFASFGTPTGSCSSPTGFTKTPVCHSQHSVEVVTEACVGNRDCAVTATCGTFREKMEKDENGDAFCYEIKKTLAVKVTCGAAPPVKLHASASEPLTHVFETKPTNRKADRLCARGTEPQEWNHLIMSPKAALSCPAIKQNHKCSCAGTVSGMQPTVPVYRVMEGVGMHTLI